MGQWHDWECRRNSQGSSPIATPCRLGAEWWTPSRWHILRLSTMPFGFLAAPEAEKQQWGWGERGCSVCLRERWGHHFSISPQMPHFRSKERWLVIDKNGKLSSINDWLKKLTSCRRSMYIRQVSKSQSPRTTRMPSGMAEGKGKRKVQNNIFDFSILA